MKYPFETLSIMKEMRCFDRIRKYPGLYKHRENENKYIKSPLKTVVIEHVTTLKITKLQKMLFPFKI